MVFLIDLQLVLSEAYVVQMLNDDNETIGGDGDEQGRGIR